MMLRVLLAMGFQDRGIRRGMLSYATKAGWSLDSSTSTASLVPRNQNWDGVVALPAPYFHELNQYLDSLVDVPIVYVDPLALESDETAIFTDHRATGHLMAEYLIDQGFKHIAFCGGKVGTSHDNRVRREGVMEACEIMGIPFYDVKRGEGGDKPWDEDMAQSILELPKPLGICAVNDRVADIAIRATLGLGLEIPSVVSVVGADNDVDLCECCPVQISSLEGNSFKQAEAACELLANWMASGTRPNPHQVVVPPGEIVERASTGFPKIANETIRKALERIELGYANASFCADLVIADLPCKKSSAYTLFKEECGTSISKYIAQRRLRRARILLASTDLSIQEIAQQSGFGNSRQLTALFNRELGTAPSVYRAMRVTSSARKNPADGASPKIEVRPLAITGM